MLKQHRVRIDLCCDMLVSRLNMTRLWPKLIENRVFNNDDVNIPRWQKNINDFGTIKDILMKIKTRGPNAFNNLLKSLRETDQEDLAIILVGSSSDTVTNHNVNNPIALPQHLPQNNSQNNAVQSVNNDNNIFDDLDVAGNGPVIVKVQKATQFLDEGDSIISRYPMRSKPRGLVLLITLINYVSNQKVRRAAEHDHRNLQQLFDQMGFEVIARWDLSADAIRREVYDFSQKPEHRKADSCFVIISGHGNKSANGETVILGIDDTGHGHPDQEISCLDIIQFFSAENCPNLVLKPKIFIFQTCRGESLQYAVMNRGRNNYAPVYNDDICITNADAPRDSGSRNFADILIAQSTLPGYVSFRDNLYGSWFIQILCEVFMKMAYAYHIHDLFNKIDEIISLKRTGRNQCQTTTLKNIGFHKHLYINPGLFLDES